MPAKGQRVDLKKRILLSLINRKPIEYFVNDNGCHIITSHHHSQKHRYPSTRVMGKKLPLSRYVFGQKYGEIPKGMFVCHKCDNPACCNVEHFFLGSHKDNMRDMIQKGRIYDRSGENNPNSKLSMSDIDKIKHDTRISREIASEYNISGSWIRKIKSKKHIEEHQNISIK
jgi:hypothetical protein